MTEHVNANYYSLEELQACAFLLSEKAGVPVERRIGGDQEWVKVPSPYGTTNYSVEVTVKGTGDYLDPKLHGAMHSFANKLFRKDLAPKGITLHGSGYLSAVLWEKRANIEEGPLRKRLDSLTEPSRARWMVQTYLRSLSEKEFEQLIQGYEALPLSEKSEDTGGRIALLRETTDIDWEGEYGERMASTYGKASPTSRRDRRITIENLHRNTTAPSIMNPDTGLWVDPTDIYLIDSPATGFALGYEAVYRCPQTGKKHVRPRVFRKNRRTGLTTIESMGLNDDEALFVGYGVMLQNLRKKSGKERRVLFVEGLKDHHNAYDRLKGLYHPLTVLKGVNGYSTPTLPWDALVEHIKELPGVDIYLDDDTPGRQGQEVIVKELLSRGVTNVRVRNSAGETKKDITDLLELHETLDPIAIAEELQKELTPVLEDLSGAPTEEKEQESTVRRTTQIGEMTVLTKIEGLVWPDTKYEKGRAVPLPTYLNFRYFLDSVGYYLYWDTMKKCSTVSKRCMATGKETTSPLTDSDYVECHTALNLNGMRISKNQTSDWMELEVRYNRRNPVKVWMESSPWDGQDRFEEFSNTLETKQDKDLKDLILRVWARTAAWVLEDKDKYANRDHGLVLILQGAQGIGKTGWAQALVPVRSWGGAVTGLNPENHDSQLKALGNWITELPEAEGILSAANQEAFKAFITAREDKLRRKYEKNVETYDRNTVFYATTNQGVFLGDATGSRRMAVLNVEKVNYPKFDLQQFWAQMLHEVRSGEQYWLSPEDQAKIGLNNAGASVEGPVVEALSNHFMWGVAPEERNNELTVSQIKKICGIDNARNETQMAYRTFMDTYEVKTKVKQGTTYYVMPPLLDAGAREEARVLRLVQNSKGV